MADRSQLGRFYVYARRTITGVAANYAIPTLIASPSSAHIIRLKAPTSNTDVIYVSQVGAAAATDLPLAPGDQHDLPNDKDTISALAASGSQNLDIIAFYR